MSARRAPEARAGRYAGVDIGSLTVEAAVVDGAGELVAGWIGDALADPVSSARAALAAVAREPRASGRPPDEVVATGYGREQVQRAGLASDNVSEISCHGLGAWRAGHGDRSLGRAVRTVIDVGGQDAKAIRVDETGELSAFAMNDKCAAGTGHFLELMARALGVSLAELGPLSLAAHRPVAVSRRCSIFVETEVHHHLQRGARPADLAAGISAAMAERVMALVRRVGVEAEVVMTGGVAKNAGVRRELERRIGRRLRRLPMDPQLVGAFGAALLARRLAHGRAGR